MKIMLDQIDQICSGDDFTTIVLKNGDCIQTPMYTHASICMHDEQIGNHDVRYITIDIE